MSDQRSPGGAPPYSRPRNSHGEHPSAGARAPLRHDRRPPAARSSPMVSALIYGGIGLIALAVAAATFIVISPPTEFIRREIIARVKSETGRDLRIAGAASFTLFPSLGLHLNDVSLSPPPGMEGEPFLTASSFDVGVRLLPLLRQEIVVDRLALTEAVLALRVDGQGRRSWDMAALATQQPVRFAEAATDRGALTDFASEANRVMLAAAEDAAERSQRRTRDIGGLSLDDIRIERGTVRYSDERDGSAHEITGIDARVALAAADQPLEAKGSFISRGETLNFAATLTAPADILAERPAKLALSVSGRPADLTYEGSVELHDVLSVEGAVKGSAPSLGALTQWLGADPTPSGGTGEVSFAGNIRAGGTSMRLSDIDLKVGNASASGTVGVETQGARPHVVADLKVSGLDLGKYAGKEGTLSPASGDPASSGPAPAPPKSAPAEPNSIEDLLERPGPQVKGFTQRSGWSAEPIELASLGLIDADAHLSIADTSYGQVRIDAADVSIGLKDRVLKATLTDVKLYDGTGHGLVTFDGTASDAAFAADVSMSGIAARPLLRDCAQIDWLAGSTNVAMKLSGRGASEAAIVQSLNGTANVAVNNGAVIGFNLDGAMSALAQGKIPDFETSPSEKTDFSEMTGTFVIANGIASNDDLKLVSPRVRASGAGTVDLPQRSLDYTVRPKLVAKLSGQGGEQDAAGIEIPVHITGPWEQPDVSPDIQGAINSPEAMEAVKEIGKGFKGKDAGEIVEDLFGKGEDGKPSKAEKLLDKFLGK